MTIRTDQGVWCFYKALYLCQMDKFCICLVMNVLWASVSILSFGNLYFCLLFVPHFIRQCEDDALLLGGGRIKLFWLINDVFICISCSNLVYF